MGSAVIFSGTKVKTLKSAIDLNGGNDIISSATDPTSSAVSANIGSLLLNSSNGKLYRKNDSGSTTNWTEVGASGQAGINYISNPNAALNTTGWSTYADAAGAAPVDGTGGSPNVTWTRSTPATPTTALRGAAEFVFAKDAADRQGQGVSTDFTIDNADVAKPLTVTFDYEVLSGTYATGDLTVYLIADPAGTPVVIQPAGYQIQAATAGTTMRNIATFQTQASGVSYRLCFHVASTSASAYDLAIDNVVCGPQVVQYGAPITDWQSYTPTFTGFGTVSTQEFYWRRVGDSLQIRGKFTSGTSTATEARISFPSGFTSADTTKLNSIEQVGSWVISVTGALSGAILIEPSVTYFTFGQQDSSRAGLTKQNGSILVASTNQLTLFGQFPIQGWSSTVVMSNDTDTRVITGTVSKSGTQSITGGVSTKVTGWTVNSDDAGTWDSTNNRFTVVVPGYYRISSVVRVSSASVSASYKVNGGSLIAISGYQTVLISGSVKSLTKLNAGDYIELFVFTSTNDTVSASDTMFQIERLTGPSAIAASETVSCKYNSGSSTANISNTTTTTVTVIANKDHDTHGSFNTSTGIFTAPVAGKYQVSCGFQWATNGTGIRLLYISPSAGQQVLAAYNQGNASINVQQSGSALFNLLAGQTVKLEVYQSSGGNLANANDATGTYFHCVKVGN